MRLDWVPYYILDDAGNPIACPDVLEWSAWHHVMSNRRVAFDTIGAGVEVSTVFLGLDHNFNLNGPPILWETFVFGGPLDGEMRRYSSRAAALAGHQEMITQAMKNP